MNFKKTIYLFLVGFFVLASLLGPGIALLGLDHSLMMGCPLMKDGAVKLCQLGLNTALNNWLSIFTFVVFSSAMLTVFLTLVFYLLNSGLYFWPPGIVSHIKFEPKFIQSRFLLQLFSQGILHPRLYA